MTRLDEWEQRLRPQMATIELIGELDLTQEEIQEIGQLIAALIRSRGPQPAMGMLQRRYPATFAAFLVFQGGSSYHSNEKGDFWPGVCEATGIPYSANYTSDSGQAFEKIIGRFGLTHEFAGHRYVGAILGHGGIPTRSLPDFFEHMLQPSITKPELAALSTSDLIIEWLDGSAQYHVDKPILRFLEYGGKVADDFVERCRRMAREYVDEGDLSPGAELGLPESLVDVYREWIEQPSRLRPIPHGGLRLRKPGIVLDPWGMGVHIVLPEQQIPPTQSLAEMWWEVDSGDKTHQIQVNARRVDMDLKTRAAHAAVQGPEREYRVRLHRRTKQETAGAGAEVLREWVFEGFDPALPLMAFDPQTNILMARPRRLPACGLWVLCPREVRLEADPASQTLIAEKAQNLPWDWYAWQCYRLNLQSVNSLRLSWGRGAYSIPVVETQEGLTAELVSGMKLDSLDDPVPLFVGAPPDLRVITGGADSPEGRLERWRFELAHEWNADPERAIKCRLNDLEDLAHRGDGTVELALSHPRLLGVSPVGQYRLRLQGPLGRSADLRFRIAPRLYLTGHEALYLPDPAKGAPVAHLLIETDPHSQVELLQSEPEFRLEELTCDDQTRCYQVAVPPNRADAPLRLVRQVTAGRFAYIPLRIPIRRLRWLLILAPSQLAQPAWQSNPSAINLGELEQSDSPYLMLELPVPESSQVTARLRFLDISGELIAELETPRPTGSAGLRRFDLRSIRDALRESQSPAIQVVLKVEGLAEHGPLTLTVLTLRRSIIVEQTIIALRQLADGQFLDVSWEPEIPLRNRCIRLWCQTQPWAEPLMLAIPDMARRSHSFSVTADAIPTGRYLVEFTVRDPWLPAAAPIRPPADSPNTKTVVIGSLEGRLAELRDVAGQGHDGFSCACESALLWQTLGQTQQALASLQACWERMSAASLHQMIILAREFRDQLTGKAIRIRLYRTDQISQVIAAHHTGALSESLVAEYLADLPPLAKLAPQACELLLTAPEAHIHLAAARHLIQQGNGAGIKAAFAWEASGRLSREGLDEMLGLNLPLATEYIASQIPPEDSVRLLLTSDNRDFQLAVATSLVRCDHSEGVLAIARLYDRHAISDAKAIAALGVNPRLGARTLSTQPPSRAMSNLLSWLLDAYPGAIPSIQAGAWVHCQLGWAQIDSLQASDGTKLTALATEDIARATRLSVTFNPGSDAIRALIDVKDKQIHFQTTQLVYQCGKCNEYIALNPHQIVGKHDRNEHEGRGASIRRLESPVRLSRLPEFRHKPP